MSVILGYTMGVPTRNGGSKRNKMERTNLAMTSTVNLKETLWLEAKLRAPKWYAGHLVRRGVVWPSWRVLNTGTRASSTKGSL